MEESSYEHLSLVYDRLMYDVDYDNWADYLLELIRKNGAPFPDIYECCCGTGSISIRLRKGVRSLVSSDISPEMLEKAAENARTAGVDINFVCGDMRDIHCTSKKDAVVACCDGANYLLTECDLKSFFSSAFESLKSGGLLLFDISSSYKLKKILGNEFFYDDSDDATVFWQNSFDENRRYVTMELTLFIPESGMYRRYDETHIQCAHEVSDILRLLAECGFSHAKAFSFLTENAPSARDERIQFAAKKDNK